MVQGDVFDLELGLDANPFPINASWFFNGQPLPEITGIELGVNFIRIQMVTQLDEGMYTVQTSNSVGMDMVSFQLLIEGNYKSAKLLKYNTILFKSVFTCPKINNTFVFVFVFFIVPVTVTAAMPDPTSSKLFFTD